MQKQESGTLYVVATPIGHLQDMTYRAVQILKSVDKIAVEDSRHSAGLLNHFGIKKPTLSLHNFNEATRLAQLINALKQGEAVALISDAGTPLISDPGYRLVSAVRAQHLKVVPIPGPCAAIAALSAGGLPTDRFCFEGFLAAKAAARDQQMKSLQHENRTMVFYEAPHRLIAALESIQQYLGADRQIVIARELTKIYESIMDGSVSDLLTWYREHPTALRGEIVILVSGAQVINSDQVTLHKQEVLRILMTELPTKQAAKLASQLIGEPKNKLYQLALSQK